MSRPPKFTLDKRCAFLDLIGRGIPTTVACREVGISPYTVYRARKKSKRFALAWDAAIDDWHDRVREKVYAIAMEDGHTHQWKALSRIMDRIEPVVQQQKIEHTGDMDYIVTFEGGDDGDDD